MLVAKGWAVRIPLEDGRTLTGMKGAALLHDPHGTHWGKNSGLVMPIVRQGRECDDKPALKYLGPQARCGEVILPPRALSGWTLEGRAEGLLYTRKKKHAGKYEHPFGEQTFAGFSVSTSSGELPRVYSYPAAGGRLLRIELGAGAVWDERGVVSP